MNLDSSTSDRSVGTTRGAHAMAPVRHPWRAAALFAALLLAIGPAAPADAQKFPLKPIRMVVPYAAGGSNDLVARIISKEIGETLGQPVVIENRPGAGTTIGAAAVAAAPPDGYTLELMANSHVITSLLYPKLPYDALADFTHVIHLGTAPVILAVNPELPVREVRELVALAKARPGQLNFASAGSGSTMHLTGELFRFAAGVNMTHVAYKGGLPAINDVVAGQVQTIFADIAAVPFLANGKLRGLAVAGPKRSAALPGLPTLAEAGVPDVVSEIWFGVLAPARVPRAVVMRLNGAINDALRKPDVAQRLASFGIEPTGGSPEAFSALLGAERRKYAEVIKAAGVRLD